VGFTNVYGVPRWGGRCAGDPELGAALERLGDWAGAWVTIERDDQAGRRATLECIDHVTVTRRAGRAPTGTVALVGRVAELDLDTCWSVAAITSEAITLRRPDGGITISRRAAARPPWQAPPTAEAPR
jgi:hypothetical protein